MKGRKDVIYNANKYRKEFSNTREIIAIKRDQKVNNINNEPHSSQIPYDIESSLILPTELEEIPDEIENFESKKQFVLQLPEKSVKIEKQLTTQHEWYDQPSTYVPPTFPPIKPQFYRYI